MTLITVATFTDRVGDDLDVDTARAAVLIDDASALVRQAADGELDATTTEDCPAVVVPVVVSAVRRALVNPDGWTSERVDDYSRDGGTPAGVYLTRDERKVVRRSVGKLSAGVSKLEGYLPSPHSERTPQTDDTWLSL